MRELNIIDMETVQQLAPNQMIVTLEDVASMPMIKKAIELIRGVKSVKTTSVKKRKIGIEKALDDVKAGRVTQWNSVDEMFDTILN